MKNILAAATLDENLQSIITKLQSLMDSFWIYIVMALAGGGRRVGCFRRN